MVGYGGLFTDTGSSALTATGGYTIPQYQSQFPQVNTGSGLGDFFVGLGLGNPQFARIAEATPPTALGRPGAPFRTDAPSGYLTQPGRELIFGSPVAENNLLLLQQQVDEAKRRMNYSNMMREREVFDQGQNLFQDSYSDQYNRYLADIARQEAAIRAQYSPTIGGLADDISDLGVAQGKVPGIFDRYYSQRDAIGAGVGPADPMAETQIREQVARVYDAAEGEMKTTFEKIGQNLGEPIAGAMYESVRQFENVMDDVLRTDIEAVDLLHEKSGEYAQALAKSAYSNDIYGAVAAETKIKAELDYVIREKQEDLARAQAAQAAAIKAARDQAFQYEEPDYQTTYQQALYNHFKQSGANDSDAFALMEDFQTLLGDPRNVGDNQTWRKGVFTWYNTDSLSKAGVDMKMIQDQINADVDPDMRAIRTRELDKLLQSKDIAFLANSKNAGTNRQLLSSLQLIYGLGNPTAIQVYNELRRLGPNLISTNSAEAKALLNAYNMKKTFDDEWDNMKAGAGQGAREQARNNVGGTVHPSVIAQYLRSEHGVSPAAAAGILANIRAESNFRSGAEGDKHLSTSSFGLFQHRGSRWNNLQDFAKRTGRSPYDWTAQVDFAIQEAKRMKHINLQSSNAEAVSRAWTIYFERPQDASAKAHKRAKYVYEYYY